MLAQMSCWDHLRLDAIRRQDIVAFVDDAATRAPFHANHMLAALRTLFNDAVRRGVVDASPVTMLKAPTRQRPRERALSDAEIGLYWHAATEIGGAFGPALKLLLLTGQRRGQIQLMEWSEIDMERRTWTTSGHKMKAGKEHQVALSDLAMEVLAAAQGIAASVDVPTDRGYVFTGRGDGRPIVAFAKAKAQLDKLMDKAAGKPLAPWRLHDLRRTMTHGLAQLGFAPHVADRILAHSQGTIHGTAAVYNQYAYLGERRDALRAWGNRVAEIVGRNAGNVVTLAG
jgi:integrase